MSSIKLTADGGGGTVELKAPATTDSNGAKVLILPDDTGTAGEVVQNSTTAGTLEMGSPFRPAFSAYTSSTYDIASDTWVKALFQTEHFDSDSAYDTSTSTFTVPANKGGAYQVNAAVSVDDINDGFYVSISLYVDGSAATGFQRLFDWSPASGKIVSASFSNVIKLTAGQTVNIYVLQSDSGTQASENYCNYFSMFRLGGVPT
tara:strand:- start:44 stop:655 length:612 start_codon:yes stop_codon:yes gene_type:complete